MTRVAAHLARYLPPAADTRPDGELLAAFLRDRDQAAFAEVLRRHGPMVWGTCRRLLPDPADAEDAFQAAFLVLVHRARRLTGQATVGPWLYRVAAWTARNLRRRNARALARRVSLSPTAADPSPGPEAAGLRADLDAALLTLPEKYRAPLVLCHLQGWSRRDAAARLGCPEGTLSSLLARGLNKLRTRLAGHDPAKALAVSAAAVPALLASATARAATASRLAASGAVSSSVAQLAEGVLRMFWVKKATAATAALLVVFGFGVGAGVSIRQVPVATAAGDGPAPAGAKPPPAGKDADPELAKLKDELAAIEESLRAARIDLTRSQEKVRLTADAVKEGKATQADYRAAEVAVTRFAEDVAQWQQRRAAVLSRIAELEANRTAAQQPPPKAPAADPANRAEVDELRGQLTRIEAELRRSEQRTAVLEAERQMLQARLDNANRAARAAPKADPVETQLADLRAKLADVETRLAEALRVAADPNAPAILRLRAERDALQARIAELEAKQKAQNPVTPAPDGPCLEVVVGGENAWWACSVKEYGPDGKAVGTLICDNVGMLRVSLARARKDPDAPRDLRITVQAGAPAARIRAVAEACKAAGFARATVTGRVITMTKQVTERYESKDYAGLPVEFDQFLPVLPDDLRAAPKKP